MEESRGYELDVGTCDEQCNGQVKIKVKFGQGLAIPHSSFM